MWMRVCVCVFTFIYTYLCTSGGCIANVLDPFAVCLFVHKFSFFLFGIFIFIFHTLCGYQQCSVATVASSHSHGRSIPQRISLSLTPYIIWYHYWAGCGFFQTEYFKQRYSLYVRFLFVRFVWVCVHIIIVIIFGCTFERQANRFWSNKVNYEDLCRGIFINEFNELHKIFYWMKKKRRAYMQTNEKQEWGGGWQVAALHWSCYVMVCMRWAWFSLVERIDHKNNEHLIQSFGIHRMPWEANKNFFCVIFALFFCRSFCDVFVLPSSTILLLKLVGRSVGCSKTVQWFSSNGRRWFIRPVAVAVCVCVARAVESVTGNK